jgi:kynureninase
MHVTTDDRAHALALDDADPLRHFRGRFAAADDDLIYLDGNSLGRLPSSTIRRLAHLIEHEWGERLIRAWDEGWLELPLQVGDRIGRSLLGAKQGEVVLADSTSVCFYKLVSAALAARPDRSEIVTDHDNFPTDRYVLEGLAVRHGCRIRWLPGDPDPEQVAAVVGPQTALVTFSHVSYRSAAVLDMAAITATAHDAGALTIWDLCHSVGAIPVELEATGADLAVGCTYKYLNGGPGAPAFLYVREQHQGILRQPIWGWLGRRDPFEMAQGYEPADGIVSMLSGTPPVLAIAAVGEGVDMVVEAGIERVREKAIALTEYAIALTDDWLAPHGVHVASPRDAARRGAHVALAHPAAQELAKALIAGGVIVDFRQPDVIRVGLSPLSTSFADVWDGLARLRRELDERG